MDGHTPTPRRAAAATITGTFSALFIGHEDGWSFHHWDSQLPSRPQPPPIAPEHLAMRFPTLDEALAFFREQYALAVDGDGHGTIEEPS